MKVYMSIAILYISLVFSAYANDSQRTKYTRMEVGSLCSGSWDQISKAGDCVRAAKALNLQFEVAMWDGPGDFPGCFHANDGRDRVYFNISPMPSRVANNRNYTAICKQSYEPTAATSNKIKDPAAVKVVAEGNADFGLRLYEKLRQEDGSNLLMSPYSVSSVMAMLQVGARKRTMEQIMKGMNFPEMKELLAGYSDVFQLTKGNKNFTLETANKLFVMENFQLLEDFLRKLRQYFSAQVTQTDFAENGGDISRKLINDWVEEKTNKKVTNLIPEGILDSLTRMVLVNAIYFKGDWASKFDSNKTQDEDFYVEEGKTVKVQMMRKLMEEFRTTYIQELKVDQGIIPFHAEIIELPYKGNRISMYIILPKDKFGFQDMEMTLPMMNISEIFAKIDNEKPIHLTLALPKFKLEKTIELSEILKNLGMNQMFINMADFSGMTETENLYVSDVIQKAFIEVNEEGSEAAAATAVIVNARSARPQEFVCDHPFVFYIRDKETNMVLFSGRVVDPTLG